jgi:hypothetical protein
MIFSSAIIVAPFCSPEGRVTAQIVPVCQFRYVEVRAGFNGSGQIAKKRFSKIHAGANMLSRSAVTRGSDSRLRILIVAKSAAGACAAVSNWQTEQSLKSQSRSLPPFRREKWWERGLYRS